MPDPADRGLHDHYPAHPGGKEHEMRRTDPARILDRELSGQRQGVHVWMPGVGLGPGSTGMKEELAMYKEATKASQKVRPCGFSQTLMDKVQGNETRHTHGWPWQHPDPEAPWVKEAAKHGRRYRRTEGIKGEVASFLCDNGLFEITDKLGLKDDAKAREVAKQVERKIRKLNREKGALSPNQLAEFNKGTFKRTKTPMMKSPRFYHRNLGEYGTRSGDQTRSK